ncbi:hypothetical protein PAXRUDRAFT_11659 [Paxillus rubicundulus Ve08.2h10]|uniref:Uncharacterized protein n=1 Tax=Paxillus rubicundulus Ve08.2h10 TaxID=930991 RepID=A0A0D0DQX2_9AGAM|nr:hypothetical protein PAXRUDRAFT_11659 [Paxillus rubicundulus Ve08.2h10]
MYPKLVALDTDWTLFQGWLDPKFSNWGKGRGARSPVEDNIERVDSRQIRDRTNHNLKCHLYADVPRIIQDILQNNARIAIVSRNSSKGLCSRALSYWKAKDPTGQERAIIDLVTLKEFYDRPKTEHFAKIKSQSKFEYSDMILFDDDATSNIVEMMLGVTFQVSRDQKGLTWDNYQQGIEMWRRNQRIRSPFLGQNFGSYPKRKFVGYAGMDQGTIRLLQNGGRRQDRKEAARWGYAMYIADNPAIASYFNEWIKGNAFGQDAKTQVCALWVRDGDLFEKMNKIWVPDQGNLQTNVQKWDESRIAWSQEDRDRKVASWGVQKPYVLFARHPNMGSGFPVRSGRWNEMVVYGQTQEALFLTFPLSDQEIKAAAQGPRFEQMISQWNITIPSETRQDFRSHGENIQ